MLNPGDSAPDFELRDGDGRRWKLSELRGGSVIIYFYPADETPGCTLEACAFRDAREDLAQAGYTILGISPQDAGSHRAFSTKYGLNFPLLVDDQLVAAIAYDTVRKKRDFYEEMPLEVVRSTFVIDENGDIVHAMYGVKAKGHLEDLTTRLGVS
jgi:peroxiredoxin Q/BCP